MKSKDYGHYKNKNSTNKLHNKIPKSFYGHSTSSIEKKVKWEEKIFLKPGLWGRRLLPFNFFIKYLRFLCFNKQMRGVWKKLRRNAVGATVVEYGLIVALIAVAALASMQTLGLSLSDFFFFVDKELEKAEGAI